MQTLPENEIRAIVQDEIRKTFSSLLPPLEKQIEEWYPTSVAWIKLGFNSHKHLLKYVEKGFFKEGIHYSDRRLKDSKRALYYFNIKKCQEELNKPANRRI